MLRRFRPGLESLERREVPTLVLLADIDSGADLISSWAGNSYGLPSIPLGHYLEPGLNFLGPTVTTDCSDQLGFGGHGSVMAGYYAVEMKTRFHIDPHVIPLVACNASGYSSQAIGEAELWVAQQQRILNAEGRNAQWIVSLPAEPGVAGLTEYMGRQALNALGIPIVQAAGNDFMNVNFLKFEFDTAPTSLVVSAANATGGREAYSNYGNFTVTCTVPDAFGTSGSCMVAAAYWTAERNWCPWLSNANLTWQVEHQGLLLGT